MAAPRAGHHGTINQSSALLIKNSLRFNASNSVLTYNVTTGGNRTTWTFSGWFKRCSTGGEHNLWSAAPGAHASNPAITYLDFNDADKLIAYSYHDGAEKFRLKTDQVFRDLNAWYHIVWRYDTTLATADDRIRLYVNGVQITDFEQRTNPDQNYESKINDTIDHTLGEEAIRDRYDYNGYMAEVHFVDGTSLDPSYFGFTDPLTNTWRPKKVQNVSYGTNGFHLDFSDPNNIGADRSGTGTNFTPTNLEIDDVVPDSPSGVTFSTTSPGITTSQPSNYCTLNPLDEGEFGGGLTVSDGNLKCVSTASDRHVRSTFFMPTSGKYYFEMIATVVNTAGYLGTGLYHATGSLTSTAQATPQMRVISANGYKSGQGSSSAQHGDGFDDRDIIGIAVDMDNGKIFACDNGSWMTSSDPVTGANPMYSDLLTAYSDIAWSPVCTNWQSGNTAEFNFGQFPMAFAPGTSSATEYFNAVTYTGNNSTNAITGVGFAPDFVWIKPRNFADHHRLNDTVRGVNKTVSSNLTSAEYGPSNAYLDSFDSDGFTVSSSDSGWNNSSYTYVAYCWKAGGAAASNTDGSITSSVSANQDAGFSIVSYTGDGNSSSTVGHDLGATPAMIMIKARAGTNANNHWYCWHKDLSSGYNIRLSSNAAQLNTSSATSGVIAAPTNTTTFGFTAGSGGVVNVNEDNTTYIAYCWAEKSGVSKFGSYTGDGNVVGPAVDVGFKPAMVIIKPINVASEWAIYDRTTTNAINGAQLRADATDAENTNLAAKVILTNYGFKILTNDAAQNGDGNTYIYMAFAENFVPDETYKELCTANLPAPTLPAAVRPDKYFNTIIYTGASPSDAAVTGVGFQPDFAWIKARTQAYSHALYDTVRGATKELHSDTTDGEDTDTNGLKSFDSDGFTVGSDGEVGDPTGTRVAWCWKAGGNSNTFNIDGVGYASAAAAGLDGGTITPTGASVNTEAGFSILEYTGTGAVATLAHGLNDDVKFILIKRTNVSGNSWAVYHDALGADKQILLNSTNAASDDFFGFNDVPSSGLIRLGSGAQMDTNQVGAHICYAWSEVPGFSKFGSYTGNGNANGPFVHCGFKPAWVMVKKTSAADSWLIMDNTRSSYNPVGNTLAANSNGAENVDTGGIPTDFLSNGFKCRGSGGDFNASGASYIFAAWAEAPTNNLFGGQANAR